MFLCKPDGFFMKATILLLLFIVLCSGCSSKKSDVEEPTVAETDLLALIFAQPPDWQEGETILINEAKDLLRYIGDEAELYLAYGFKRMAIRKYSGKGKHTIQVEAYEFDSSENAYGIYSFDTVGDKLDIGQDSVYGHGVLRFWKDKMLVRVIVEEEYQDLEEDILEIGRLVNSNILTEGSRPGLLSLIPGENLVPDSVHFFHENICLNNICYIPESAMLGLSGETNAVTAQYALEGKRPPWRLILIEYPSEPEAKIAFENFSAPYFQGEPVSVDQRINVVKFGEGEFSSVSLKRNFLIIVLEARHSELCTKLVAATLAKIELYGRR